MVEGELRVAHAKEPGLLGGIEGLRLGSQPGGRAEDGPRRAALVGRGDQQEGLGLVREAAHTGQEGPLDARADRERLEQRLDARELGVAQRRRQLEQGQGVPVGPLDQPPARLGRERDGRVAVEQRLGRVGIEPCEPDLVEAGGLEAAGLPVAGGEHHRDPLGFEAAPSEDERLGRGVVEPVRVVDEADEGTVLRLLRQEAQHRERDQEPLVAGPGFEPQ